MKYSTLIACLALLAATGLGQAPASTAAAPTGPIRIGIINIQFAIVNTQEGKADEAKLNTRFAPKRQQLQQENQAIKSLQTKLQAGGDTLSAEAKADLASTIATKQKELRNDYSDAQTDFRNATNDMVNGIGQKMVGVLAQYAQQHHLSLVLDHSLQWPQNPILYATPAIDVTKQIITRYNRKFPAAAPAATPAAKTPAPKP